MKTMPCGYKRTGKLKEHIAHYKECEHPTCKDRLAAWDNMKKEFSKGATIIIKKEEK
jgi:hypothetical protein